MQVEAGEEPTLVTVEFAQQLLPEEMVVADPQERVNPRVTPPEIQAPQEQTEPVVVVVVVQFSLVALMLLSEAMADQAL
jgi:hypothetical protein